MKKLLSIFLLALMATNTFAAKVYYCDPLATNTKAKGSSWDDAVTLAMLRKSLNGTGMNGATIYIKGGTIKFTEASDFWTIKSGVTLIGGFDPQATGTATELPTYPSATPTIFDGDINNDGMPSKGDATTLMRVNFSEDSTKVITIKGFDFINTYYDTEESPNDEKTAMNECAALRLIRGTAFVQFCHFYNHISPNNRGSQCVTSVGARLHMSDCELHDCASLSRGGLLRLRNFFINNDPDQPRQPDCVLERCCFYSGNSMGGESMVIAQYGAAVHVSYGPLFAINCTFANNLGYSDGGAVSANEAGVNFISCSFLNNYCARSDNMELEAKTRNSYGSAFHVSHDAPIRLANNFVLDDLDDASKRYALMYTDNNTVDIEHYVTSGGYNVMGTLWIYKNGQQQDDQTAAWLATDIWTRPTSGTAEHYKDYFGTDKKMQKNGGFSKSILPLAMQPGAKVSDLQALADQWCPSWTKVDASVDQRGFKRDANVTCVGAAAFEAKSPSALEEVQSSIINHQSSIYNVLGQPVDENYKGIVIKKGQKYLVR